MRLVRPKQFELDFRSTLSRDLVFSGLGNLPFTKRMWDTSIRRNHGTLTDMDPSTDWVFIPELGRWGLDFDGGNDCVLGSDNFAIGDTYSISLWIYLREHGGYDGIVVKSSSSSQSVTDFAIRFDSTSNSGRWHNVRSASPGSVGTAIPFNTWTHIVGICGASTSQQWMDGVQTRNDAGVGGATTTNTAGRLFQIARNWDKAPNAIMADVCCFSRALTPNEIADLADPSNVYLSGLIAGRPRRRYFLPSSPSTTFPRYINRYQSVAGSYAAQQVQT